MWEYAAFLCIYATCIVYIWLLNCLTYEDVTFSLSSDILRGNPLSNSSKNKKKQNIMSFHSSHVYFVPGRVLSSLNLHLLSKIGFSVDVYCINTAVLYAVYCLSTVIKLPVSFTLYVDSYPYGKPHLHVVASCGSGWLSDLKKKSVNASKKYSRWVESHMLPPPS